MRRGAGRGRGEKSEGDDTWDGKSTRKENCVGKEQESILLRAKKKLYTPRPELCSEKKKKGRRKEEERRWGRKEIKTNHECTTAERKVVRMVKFQFIC